MRLLRINYIKVTYALISQINHHLNAQEIIINENTELNVRALGAALIEYIILNFDRDD
jgi:hypothetical protein